MTRSTKIRIFRQGASMLFYPAALPLSRQTLTYTAGIIRRHRLLPQPSADSRPRLHPRRTPGRYRGCPGHDQEKRWTPGG